MVIKHPIGPSDIPNGQKIYQQKLTQIGIFGFTINNLATLYVTMNEGSAMMKTT
jgi:hypothetical protein